MENEIKDINEKINKINIKLDILKEKGCLTCNSEMSKSRLIEIVQNIIESHRQDLSSSNRASMSNSSK